MRVLHRVEFRSQLEAEAAARILASRAPRPDLVFVGLMELALNAVEHGNLELDFAAKRVLLDSGQWQAELDRRLSLSPWQERVAWAEARQADDGHLCYVVEDQGPGFDFKRWLATPASADRLNGRGIHLARCLSFEEVRFEGRGNRVLATVST